MITVFFLDTRKLNFENIKNTELFLTDRLEINY